tara:strand:- start:19620 stop:20798 length:1179 start_codon:yes stop_codon:yes gene_type:complete
VPKKKRKRSKKQKFKFKRKKRKIGKFVRKVTKKKVKSKRSKKTRKKKKYQKKNKRQKVKSRSINLAIKFIRAGEKFKSLFRFRLNLDQRLQSFFQGASNKILSLRKAIQIERERLKKMKIKEMEREKLETEKRIKLEQEMMLKARQQEYKDEIKIEKDRKQFLQNFLRQEQAEIRKEHAERQRKFLEQIKLEKKIEKFRQREANEIKTLTKYVLNEQRENYKEVEERITEIKKRYQELRDQKIRERVEQLGIEIAEGDDRTALLEKEKNYYLERKKIEDSLYSYYRSANSLCYQINRRFLGRHLSLFRCKDFMMERGEVLIKFDDMPDEEWLILIYLDSKSADGNIIIEDKSNPEKNFSKEFKRSQIFEAQELMVDSLTQLISRERLKRKAS